MTNTKVITPMELIKALSTPKIHSYATAGSYVMQLAYAGEDLPKIAQLEHDHHGFKTSIEGIPIYVDDDIVPLPRQMVSKAFEEVQSRELVRETNAWLYRFFGTFNPVYIVTGSRFHGGTHILIGHSGFQELTLLLHQELRYEVVYGQRQVKVR